ncbi:MAG: HAD family hydrolase [Desulfofustis sp. PB-SRB1]|jgi:phosphoglycolate phosphatase|nr:HAD family hydrolase [Desulfofustis sp. PB-SRB1]MBM1001853.1 HAD family hydrolase [Desulfofustis sp. PB-SRB1]HBH28111.1 HAD family hydrolase [Desulfofustis sp.]
MKKQAVDGCIFDLDGTLVNTLDGLAATLNSALGEHSLPEHPIDAYRHFIGDGLVTLIRRACPPDTPAPILESCRQRFREIYGQKWRDSAYLYPGIPETLHKLKEAGVRLAILSNKPDEFTQQFNSYFFAPDLFECCFGQRQHVPRKPDPSGLLEIIKLLGLTPSQVAYVGDSSTDMLTGRRAGVLTIGVSWGFRPTRELRETGAHRILNKPEELLDYLT